MSAENAIHPGEIIAEREDLSTTAPVVHAHEFFVDGDWVEPAGDGLIEVADSTTEEVFLTVSAAGLPDMDRAIGAARRAFDEGPWPRMSHRERAVYLHRIADELDARSDVIAQFWPRQSGALFSMAKQSLPRVVDVWRYYADLADHYPFEKQVPPTVGGRFGLLVQEPVGVVAAILPWNGPISPITYKVAPALLAGCTVIIKPSPEAPAEALIVAEAAKAAGLPAGVLNVLTAERDTSEQLVVDGRVDCVSFTGSSPAGRRIASLLGDRIGRSLLELGGKSAAVIMDDYDLGKAAYRLGIAGCSMAGQVCSSLTRIIVNRTRHDEFVANLAEVMGAVRVGDPFDPRSEMGPLTSARHRDRVQELIDIGVAEGAKLVTGGRPPRHLDRGYFIEPTVFGDVNNSSTIARTEVFGPVLLVLGRDHTQNGAQDFDSTIARTEVFGPVLSVIAAENEEDAIRLANDSIYGLNASVFTDDVERARDAARRLRSGTVGHNAFRTDFGMAFGGFKQSGIGRAGGEPGMLPYLETKTVILNGTPSEFELE